LDDARVRRWSRDHVSSDITHFNSDATIEAPLEGVFPTCQIKGLQERLKLIYKEISVGDRRGRFVVGEDLG
jgi:hypothetical protein